MKINRGPISTNGWERMWVLGIAALSLALTLMAVFVHWEHDSRLPTIRSPRISSGDEPHYLLMVNSLLFDRDLNLHADYDRVAAGGLDAGRIAAGDALDHHTFIADDTGKPRLWFKVKAEGKLPATTGAPPVETSSHPIGFPALIASLLAPFRPASPATVEFLAIVINAVLAWLAVLVTYPAGRRAGLSRIPAALAMGLVGLASSWAPYSGMFFSETSAGLFLILALWAQLAKRPALAALAIGAAFLNKPPYALVGVVWILTACFTQRFRLAAWLALVCGVIGVTLAIFNYGQAERILISGHGTFMLTHSLNSLSRTFLNVENGLLPFNPWALAGLLAMTYGVVQTVRRKVTDETLWLTFPILAYMLLLLAFRPLGGSCYGPRYWIPFLPWLAIAALRGLQEMRTSRFYPFTRTALSGLALLGLVVAVPASVSHQPLWNRAPWVILTWPLLGYPIATVDEFRWWLNERQGKEAYPRLPDGARYETMTFDARQEPTLHRTGREEVDGWTALPPRDKPGHMLFGPYTRTVRPGARHTARFTLRVENTDPTAGAAEDASIVDVYDSTFGRLLAQQSVPRGSARASGAWVDYDLLFDSLAGHCLEFRVFYSGIAPVTVRSVTIDP